MLATRLERYLTDRIMNALQRHTHISGTLSNERGLLGANEPICRGWASPSPRRCRNQRRLQGDNVCGSIDRVWGCALRFHTPSLRFLVVDHYEFATRVDLQGSSADPIEHNRPCHVSEAVIPWPWSWFNPLSGRHTSVIALKLPANGCVNSQLFAGLQLATEPRMPSDASRKWAPDSVQFKSKVEAFFIDFDGLCCITLPGPLWT